MKDLSDSARAEPIGTWTAYPSLLNTLSPEAQKALEEAACAHYCGRYLAANAIFIKSLLLGETSLPICLQRADMLTTQGIELERIHLLERAIKNLKSDCNQSEDLLLHFMLADARFWAFGQPRPLAEMLVKVRNHLQSIGIDKLSDVEFRCTTLYYSSVENLGAISNFVKPNYQTIFQSSNGDKSLELRKIRQALQDQGRFRLVSTVLQMELKCCPGGLDLRDLVTLSSNLAKQLDALQSPPMKFRSVILRKSIADILASVVPTWSVQEQQSYLATLRTLKDTSVPQQFPSWDQFAPVIAFDLYKAAILSSDQSEMAKIEHLISLAQSAQQRNDHTKTNQAYIAARDTANTWFEQTKSSDEAPNAQEMLLSVKRKMFHFHRETTKMLYFHAYCLSDYLTTLFLVYHDYDGILVEIDQFEDSNPDFAIPDTQTRLFNQASVSARTRGYVDRLEVYEEKHREWYVQSHYYIEGGGFTDEAIMNPDYAVNYIDEESSSDPKAYGQNAIGLILRWMANEHRRGILSAEECKNILRPGLRDAPATTDDGSAPDFAAYLEGKEKFEIAELLLGTVQEPTSASEFLEIYHRLLNWIILKFSKQENTSGELLWASGASNHLGRNNSTLSARLFALRIFLQSRLYILEEHKIFKVQSRDIDPDDVAAYEKEFQVLQDLKDMEAVETGASADSIDQRVESAIHMTLVKCAVPNVVKEGLVNEAEILARVEDCQKLAARYHNNNHQLFQYHVLCQKLRLYWWLSLFYGHDSKVMLETIQEADALYLELRRSVASTNPPAQLIAGITLSQEFSHREHFNFALAATYSLMKKHHGQDQEVHYRNEFLSWTFKSKGRGFTDMLDIEFSVDQEIRKSKDSPPYEPSPVEVEKVKSYVGGKDQANDPSNLVIEDKEGVLELDAKLHAKLKIDDPDEVKETLDANAIDTYDFTNMVNSLPEDTAIVDFINVAYLHGGDTLVATIYRPNIPSTIVEISGIKMREIAIWLKDNITGPKSASDWTLNQADADQRLERLSPLLSPIFDTTSKESIKKGETVILCPTQILNRVPIHAIPVDGKPLIERNPVVYCQSLSILQRLIQRVKTVPRHSDSPRTLLLNPLPDDWPSTVRVNSLAKELKAEFLHGLDLLPSEVVHATQGVKLFHYHGHVEYNHRSGLDSKLLLYDPKAKTKPRKASQRKTVTARSLFTVKFDSPALATLIGCGSGISTSSSNDELLGFPTALFYAGASSVVSTLWPILDDDGADFGTVFYAAIRREQKDISDDKIRGKDLDGMLFSNLVNLAHALQTAILDMRRLLEAKGSLVPYHWAAFTLNGFWLLEKRDWKGLMKVEQEKLR